MTTENDQAEPTAIPPQFVLNADQIEREIDWVKFIEENPQQVMHNIIALLMAMQFKFWESADKPNPQFDGIRDLFKAIPDGE